MTVAFMPVVNTCLQPGNPEPRFFRLEEDSAAINRYGFNSLGHGQTLAKLKARIYAFARSNPSYFPSNAPSTLIPPSGLPRSLRPGHILAVNLGKNKTSAADSNEDYIKGVRTLGPYADVVVINVSSPNTPGLRALQGRRILEGLLKEVVAEREKIKDGRGLPKIAVKVTCDLSEDELGDVAYAVRKTGVEGVIVSNTTVRRDGLDLKSSESLYSDPLVELHPYHRLSALSPADNSGNRSQVGGLSGRPLFPYALDSVRTLRSLLPPEIPVIGCGGISTGFDAIDMAKAGAAIVQIYTSFGYRGVGAPRLLKDEIITSLRAAGPGSKWTDIVDTEPRRPTSVDQDPLKAGSEALRREAQGLGEMLRRMNEEDDTRRLVEEAEAALRGVRMVGHQETPQEPTQAQVLQPQALEGVQTEVLPPAVPLLVLPNPEPEPVEVHEEVARAILETGHERGETTPAILEAGHDDADDHWRENVQRGERRIV